MGGSGSSSKKKSSKRKRDKKKKIRRKETKRHRRKYDSASSHSDDESLSSEHTASFIAKSDRGRRKTKNRKHRLDSSLPPSFDDKSMNLDSDSSSAYDHKRKHRKGRRSQSSLRSSKKRDKKKLASKNSDSDVRSARKRKREGRDVKSRKKSSNKRSRKYSSSDSESSPTCQSGSDNDSESKHRPRSKLIIDGEEARMRGRESDMTHNKQIGRVPYTSSSDHIVGANDGDEAVTCVDNPRRLKSVIAVVNQSCDEGEDRWDADPHKEVIVYDQEDYPSPKSLDSYEGATKMESDNNSHSASRKRAHVENVVDEEATAPEKHKISDSDQNNAGIPQSAGGIEASAPAAALGGDDLESILRQKALENLRKFRGKPPVGPKSTNVKTNNESDVSKLPAERVDSVQSKPAKPNSSNARETISTNVPSLRRKFSQLNEAKESLDNKRIEKKGGVDVQTATVECAKEVKGTSSRTVLSKHDSREAASTFAGAANDCNSSMEKPTTSAGPVSGENSSGQQNEDKDGSQFEQRTMMVMRGGEMVQVSYKVYIPKKPPALARRQFRQ